MKINIEGHHNSGFRDVKRSFKNKGTPVLNLIAGFMATINYEEGYRGWYEEYSGIFIGKARIKKAVEMLASEALAYPDKDNVVILHAIDEDTKKEDPSHGIAIWAYVKEKNYGVGEVHKSEKNPEALQPSHSDKYENRWFDFV